MREENVGRTMAKQRDLWLSSEDGLKCSMGSTEGQYLRNRLERAFLAGIEAGRQIERAVIQTRIFGAEHENTD